MITKDNVDLPILEITPENYLVPKGEERSYHVKMEVKDFDRRTGERRSHPFIQKFARVDFENGMMSLLRQQGYDMVILHDPKKWIAEQAAKAQEVQAKRKAQAEAKAEEEKKAMMAQIRAELKAEMKAEMEAEAKKTSKKTSKKAENPEEALADPEDLDLS